MGLSRVIEGVDGGSGVKWKNGQKFFRWTEKSEQKKGAKSFYPQITQMAADFSLKLFD